MRTQLKRRWRVFLRYHHAALGFTAGSVIASVGWFAFYQLTHGRF